MGRTVGPFRQDGTQAPHGLDQNIGQGQDRAWNPQGPAYDLKGFPVGKVVVAQDITFPVSSLMEGICGSYRNVLDSDVAFGPRTVPGDFSLVQSQNQGA